MKEANRSLGRIQALLLDAVGPLANVLELHQMGRLTPDATANAVTQGLCFLGIAHANVFSKRRKKTVLLEMLVGIPLLIPRGGI